MLRHHRIKHQRRAAALVEYVVLMSFIAIVAIVSVSRLGGEVRDAFDGAATEVAEKVEFSVTVGEDGSATVAPGPSGSFTIPGELPPNASPAPNGVIVDLTPIVAGYPAGTELRYDVTVDTSGSFSRRIRFDLPDSSYGMSINTRVWMMTQSYQDAFPSGNGNNIAGGADSAIYPDTTVAISDTELNRPLPSDVLYVRLENFINSCTYYSSCSLGGVVFNFTVYPVQ